MAPAHMAWKQGAGQREAEETEKGCDEAPVSPTISPTESDRGGVSYKRILVGKKDTDTCSGVCVSVRLSCTSLHICLGVSVCLRLSMLHVCKSASVSVCLSACASVRVFRSPARLC